jgi:hypothetical protein
LRRIYLIPKVCQQAKSIVSSIKSHTDFSSVEKQSITIEKTLSMSNRRSRQKLDILDGGKTSVLVCSTKCLYWICIYTYIIEEWNEDERLKTKIQDTGYDIRRVGQEMINYLVEIFWSVKVVNVFLLTLQLIRRVKITSTGGIYMPQVASWH